MRSSDDTNEIARFIFVGFDGRSQSNAIEMQDAIRPFQPGRRCEPFVRDRGCQAEHGGHWLEPLSMYPMLRDEVVKMSLEIEATLNAC